MPTPNEPELTLEAQHAIRAYLLKLLSLPAVVISIVSFALGYGFQKEAAANAVTEAMKVLPRVNEASTTAQVASDRASTAKANTENVLAEATKLFNDLKRQDDLQKALHQTDRLIGSITETLRNDPSFVQDVINAAGVVPHAEQGRTGFSEKLSDHVPFKTTFTKTPQIMVALGEIDANGYPKWKVDFSDADEHGFNYTVTSIGPEMHLGRADVIWIAIGK